jgi:hypothetical protein
VSLFTIRFDVACLPILINGNSLAGNIVRRKDEIMWFDAKTVVFAVVGGGIGLFLIIALIVLETHLPKSHSGNYGWFVAFWGAVFVSLHVVFYAMVKASAWIVGAHLKPKKLYISRNGDWWLGGGDNTFDEPVAIALPDDFDVDEFLCCTPPALEVFKGMFKSEMFDTRLFDVMPSRQGKVAVNTTSPRVLFIAPNGQYWFGDRDNDDATVIMVPGRFAITQFYSRDAFIGMYKSKQLDRDLFPEAVAEIESELRGATEEDDDDSDADDADEDEGDALLKASKSSHNTTS